MASKFLLGAIVSFILAGVFLIVGIIGFVGFNNVYEEIGTESDFTVDYDYDNTQFYYLEFDSVDMGTDIWFKIDMNDGPRTELGVYIYLDDDLEGSFEDFTPFEGDLYIGTGYSKLTIEVYIWDEDIDIDDLDITVESNGSVTWACFGFAFLFLSILVAVPLGIILIILHSRRMKRTRVDNKYAKEIKELQAKIKEMEGIGMDTSQERKLLEKYKKG